ncbi:hypothetical protein DIC82_16630 [Clostridium beijerinckii]|nr:hypothetical protein DIC82_16630 [Clostridium beijerinckii]
MKIITRKMYNMSSDKKELQNNKLADEKENLMDNSSTVDKESMNNDNTDTKTEGLIMPNSLPISNAVVNGWVKDGDTWYYYVNGQKVTGWRLIDSYWYYFESSGAMKRGWLYLGGFYYYLFYSGQMATGWQNLDGKTYHFYSNGQMSVEWAKIDGGWYYFSESGELHIGWLDLDGTWYYSFSTGETAIGWLQLGDKWYYFDESGKMQRGWKLIEEYYYYFFYEGEMATGWQSLDNVSYYFYQETDVGHKEGSMAANTIVESYVLDKNGKMIDTSASALLGLSGTIGIFHNSIISFIGFNFEKALPIFLSPSIQVSGKVSLEQSIYNATGNLNLTVGSANELSNEITNGLSSANIAFDFTAQNIADSISAIGASAQVNDNIKLSMQ